ncbi:MAG TPA: hypothetical protein VGE45_04455 [Chloroflexia bacterium]|jgi:hypothetical protein
MAKTEHDLRSVKSSGNGSVSSADIQGDVRHFLERQAFLVPILNEALLQIAEYFPQAQVVLDLSSDAEGSPSDEQLLLLIGTNLSSDVALVQLKCFDRDWWLDKVDQAQGKLIINVELR